MRRDVRVLRSAAVRRVLADRGGSRRAGVPAPSREPPAGVYAAVLACAVLEGRPAGVCGHTVDPYPRTMYERCIRVSVMQVVSTNASLNARLPVVSRT